MFRALYSRKLFYAIFVVLSYLSLAACGGGGSTPETDTHITATLQSISIGAVNTPLKAGQRYGLSVLGTFSDGRTLDISNQANWTSLDNSTLSVSGTGILNAISAGNTRITATVAELQSSISVSTIALTGLAISDLSNSLDVNDTQQLSVTGTYSDTSTEDVSSLVSWSSSDFATATISDSGLLTVIASGNTSITASIDELNDSETLSIITLEGLSLSSISSTLQPGDTQQLSATASYSNTTTQSVTSLASWSSSDTGIATVSSAGLLTIISTGNVTLSATFESFSQQSSTSIITLDGLSLSTISSTLQPGDTQQLSATASYSDTTTESVTNLTRWSSSDTDVATISNTGLLNIISAGNVTLSATFENLTQQSSTSIITLDELSLSTISSTLQPGDTQQLSATASYSDATTQSVTSLASWLSSDTGVAAVSSAGLLSIISAGNVTLSVTFENLTQQSSIAIITLESLSIDGISQGLKLDQSQQLTVTGLYSDGSTQDISRDVSWLSDTPSILSVSSSGLVSSLSVGSSIITASLNGVSSTTTATAIDLASINLSPSTLTFAIESSQQFIATGIYTDNSTEDLSDIVTWDSSTTSIATITSNGLLTSHAAGISTISAAINGTSGDMDATVSPATLNAIEINAPSSLIAGLTTQLTATGTFSDGSTQDISNELDWSVDDSDVASITTNTGLVTAIKTGDFIVSATNGLQVTSANISVSPATMSNIVITPSTLSLAKGTNNDIVVTAIFSDQTHQDVSNQISWESRDISIASIVENSIHVTANDLGTTTLTATLSANSADLQITVTNAELNSLSILPIAANIPKGLNQNFTASGHYTDGSVQDLSAQVTWLSSNEAVSTIENTENAQGLANAINAGETTITAILGEISQSTTLNIDNALLRTIEIQPTSQTVAKGIDIQTSVIGHYSDGSQVDITDRVTWGSSNSSVADISSTSPGLINSLSEGETLISASLEDINGLGFINVTSATLQSIDITASTDTLPKGSEQSLSATGTYSDTSTTDITQQVTWQSSDNAIFSLDNNGNQAGLVRAISLGQASASATLNNVSANKLISVTNATLSSIDISTIAPNINLNASNQATAIATYSDSSTKDVSNEVNWISSDTSIASIENMLPNNGLINAIATGNTVITATLLDTSANLITSNSVNIEITEDPNAPLSVSLSLSPNVILNNGTDSTLLSATVQATSITGTIADNTLVTFTIIEDGISRIETANTLSGVASLTLTSTTNDLISIEANVSADITSTTGLFSTDNFANVILTSAQSRAAYDSENRRLLKDSVLLMLIQNTSNRDFNINQISIGHGSPLIHFPDSPISAPEFLSGGILSGGEYSAFGYILDTDIDESVFAIVYDFTDPDSTESFNLGSFFSF
jgi:uncharacterized protein YjdB